MKLYVGYGPEHGVTVRADDAFYYVVTHLCLLPPHDRAVLARLLAGGITEEQLVAWYFSGCFAEYEEEAYEQIKQMR